MEEFEVFHTEVPRQFEGDWKYEKERKKEPPFHKAVLDLIREKCNVVPLAVVDSSSALSVTMSPEDESSPAASVAAASRSRSVTPTAGAVGMATKGARAEQRNEDNIPVIAAHVVPGYHTGIAVQKSPIAEGAASKCRAVDWRQMRQRASAATAFSVFVNKLDDCKKKRSKDAKSGIKRR